MGDLMSVIEYWEDVKDWAENLGINIERAVRNPASQYPDYNATDSDTLGRRVDYDNIEDYFETPRQFEKWFKAHLLLMKKNLEEYRGNVPLDSYYEKSLITLVNNLHTFPKVDDDTKALEIWLKKYDDMVTTLQIEFMNELNKMAAPHKGGTIETTTVRFRPPGGSRSYQTSQASTDAFMRGLREIISSSENKPMMEMEDPNLDVIKMMLEPVPVNVFHRIKEGQEHDTMTFTLNSNEMRAIRQFLEKIRVHKNEQSRPHQLGDSPKWKYGKDGNLQPIEVDEGNTLVSGRFIKLLDDNNFQIERSKHNQFTKIIDSNMPIKISLKKHYLLSKGSLALGSLHNRRTMTDETRKSGQIVLDKYINPKMAHEYFSQKENLTKKFIKNQLERGRVIPLPHLHVSIRNTMPEHFPSDEVVEILSTALFNYENKLHIKYVEGEFSNVFSKIDFTNINTLGVETKGVPRRD